MNDSARTLLALAHGGLCFDPGRINHPSEALFDPAHPSLSAQPVQEGGRRSAWFVSGEFGRAVLRHYRRGGMVAKLSRKHYVFTGASSTRSFAEFQVMQYLQTQGVRVPTPLAAAYWRSGLFYRAAILIERVENVRTLAGSLDAPAAVAQAIHAMHEADVWHADLNAFNILLDAENRAWLIDFDRATRRTMSAALRRSNMLRLRRSLIKVAGPAGDACWSQIMSVYAQLGS